MFGLFLAGSRKNRKKSQTMFSRSRRYLAQYALPILARILSGSVYHSFLYKPVLIPPADPFIPYCRSLSLFSSFFLSTNAPISRFPFPISPIPHSNQPFHSSFSTLSLSLTNSLTFSSSRSCRVYPPFPSLPRRGLFFLFSGWSSSIRLFDLLFPNPPSHPHHLHPPLLSLPLSLCQDSSFV